MPDTPLNPDESDQYEYRIDALIQRRAKGTDEDFQTFGLALTEDGREYLGESVDDLNSMVSTGLFEVVDGPIPGHCPNCSEKIAVALTEVTSVEELEALPQDSVIRSVVFGVVRERFDSGWLATGGEGFAQSSDIAGRAHVVLYRPEANDA